MQQQDHTMDSMSGTLHTIAQQASLIGNELEEHNEYVGGSLNNLTASHQLF